MKKTTKTICFILALILCFSLIPVSVFAASQYRLYEIQAYNVKDESTSTVKILNFDGSAYITPQTAALLSEMSYSKLNDKHQFKTGLHRVTFSGQQIEYQNAEYIRMVDALDQLSCAYTYIPGEDVLGYAPTHSFVENLAEDCDDVFFGLTDFDLRWVKDIPLVELTAWYEIIAGGWRLDALWGGNEIEQYEKTLWGIMMPSEDESEFLSQVSDANKAAKTLSTIVKYVNEVGGEDVTSALLGPTGESLLYTYNQLNKAIPGLKISDYLGLLENAYGAQYASHLFVNSVKYGLYQNKDVDDVQLSAATTKVYKHFKDNSVPLEAFISDFAYSFSKEALQKMLEDAMKEALGFNSVFVKMFKLATDKIFGMESKTQAVATLLDCAEIQQEALEQYGSSYTIISSDYNDCDALQMKYSTLLFLRACQYGYETYRSTGDIGEDAYNVTYPKAQEKIELIAGYSDEELTRTIENKNLDFSLPGFEEILAEDPPTDSPTDPPTDTPTEPSQPDTPPASDENDQTVPEGYIGIFTAADLDAVRNDLDGKYILMNDIDLGSWGNWDPIGEYFTGVFDGNGYSILNMQISDDGLIKEDSVNQYEGFAGLFAFLEGATVKNIANITGQIDCDEVPRLRAGGVASTALDSYIYRCSSSVIISYKNGTPDGETCNDSPMGMSVFAGGIAGLSSSTTIDECCNTGTITGIAKSAGMQLGGIVGNAGSQESIQIRNCYNSGALSATTGHDTVYMGGISGFVGYGMTCYNSCSYNVGTITCQAGGSADKQYVGGITGFANGDKNSNLSFIYCYHSSQVASGVDNLQRRLDAGETLKFTIDTVSKDNSLLKQQATYIGFDFSNVWVMNPDISPYPVLKWQE